MKYTNLQILKELKHIEKSMIESDMEKLRNLIYSNWNVWLKSYLIENKYLIINTTNSWEIPFLTPYWNDFLKYNSWIKCYIIDNQWLINSLIWICIAIITWILIIIITK